MENTEKILSLSRPLHTGFTDVCVKFAGSYPARRGYTQFQIMWRKLMMVPVEYFVKVPRNEIIYSHLEKPSDTTKIS